MSLLSVFISEAHVCLTFRVLGPSLPPSLADEKVSVASDFAMEIDQGVYNAAGVQRFYCGLLSFLL